MKTMLIAIFSAYAAPVLAANNDTCMTPDIQSHLQEVAQRRIYDRPVPQTRGGPQFSQFPSNGRCCVSYEAEPVYSKPDCQAYRMICADLQTWQVVQDSHNYNGWCDY